MEGGPKIEEIVHEDGNGRLSVTLVCSDIATLHCSGDLKSPYISNLVVHEDHRGYGLATEMFAHLLCILTEKKVAYVIADIHHVAALKICAKFGYEENSWIFSNFRFRTFAEACQMMEIGEVNSVRIVKGITGKVSDINFRDKVNIICMGIVDQIFAGFGSGME